MAKQLTKKAMLEVLDKQILAKIKLMNSIGNHPNMTEEAKEMRYAKASNEYILLDCLRDEFNGEAK